MLSEAICYSDASSTAHGAHVEIRGTEHKCHKAFSEKEIVRSSTWRELEAIRFALQCFGHKLLRGKIVKWFTDNQSAVRIVLNGSRKFDLQALAMAIFTSCSDYDITLELEWIPRSENEIADSISREVDRDDWSVSQECFEFFEQAFGPHTVDCFASAENTKLKKFYSRYWEPACAGVDGLCHSWNGENCWCVPPVQLIQQVLWKVERSGIEATLLIPEWPSAAFWPFLADFAKIIVDKVRIEGARTILVAGGQANSIFSPNAFNGNFLALRLRSSLFSRTPSLSFTSVSHRS